MCAWKVFTLSDGVYLKIVVAKHADAALNLWEGVKANPKVSAEIPLFESFDHSDQKYIETLESLDCTIGREMLTRILNEVAEKLRSAHNNRICGP